MWSPVTKKNMLEVVREKNAEINYTVKKLAQLNRCSTKQLPLYKKCFPQCRVLLEERIHRHFLFCRLFRYAKRRATTASASSLECVAICFYMDFPPRHQLVDNFQALRLTPSD
ncbi:hypothetical protein E2C01_009755 [Portunus trituberculatus]|uniref:Uncharacterized protein n=1 Tax=Portunus trituberculatus TaxID=210409 RepID=A0A5B7D6U3_PORTR|nr:hypothetical protein [Portunus trituberculatus]